MSVLNGDNTYFEDLWTKIRSNFYIYVNKLKYNFGSTLAKYLSKVSDRLLN